MTPFGTAFAQELEELIKEAGKKKRRTPPGPPDQLPQLSRLTGVQEVDGPKLREFKRAGGYLLAGGGTGKFLSGWALGKNRKAEVVSTTTGAAVGLGEYLRRRHLEKKKHPLAKSATVANPLAQLKATQASSRFVKKTTTRMMAKPTLQGLIPKI